MKRALLVVAALPALYVGAYLALLCRTPTHAYDCGGNHVYYRATEYLIGHNDFPESLFNGVGWADWAFEPINVLDRRLFPERWELRANEMEP